jgi:S1-C subfamily serine protease
MPKVDSGARDQVFDASRLFEQTSPSVYFVLARGTGGNDSASGSAVAVAKMLLLTNCHVLGQDKAILVSDGETGPWHAELHYADRESDRCVLQSSRPVTPIGAVRPYSDLKTGERVYAIGNPSGLMRTLAEGLISGLRRRDGLRLVQTSAAISPGSSGGGLFDSRGRLIGITTFRVARHESLAFAIAADEFMSLPVFGQR